MVGKWAAMRLAPIVLHPRTVGILRAAAGVVILARPRATTTKWVGVESPSLGVLARSVGVRDVAIGTGLALQPTLPWLAASVASDVVDGLGASEIPIAQRRRSTRAVAFGYAAYGLLTAAAHLHRRRRLRRAAPGPRD